MYHVYIIDQIYNIYIYILLYYTSCHIISYDPKLAKNVIYYPWLNEPINT